MWCAAQHPSDTGGLGHSSEELPVQRRTMGRRHVGHLVSIDNLSDNDLESLFRRADVFHRSGQQAPDRLNGRLLAVLFYEPSTRTRLSFESAILRLGGRVLGFADASSSSVSKGETVADTIRMIGAYADAIVIRHPCAGSTQVAAEFAQIPLVSGGDGAHLHPTQTLTDLYYLRRVKGGIRGLTVAVAGDLNAGRTVHSLATALARLGAHIVCVAPAGLGMPDYVVDEVQKRYGGHIDRVERLDDCLADVDVLYMTRLQRERLPESLQHVVIPRVDGELLRKMRPDTVILHPLPRVDEIAYEVDKDLRAGYFEQAAGGGNGPDGTARPSPLPGGFRDEHAAVPRGHAEGHLRSMQQPGLHYPPRELCAAPTCGHRLEPRPASLWLVRAPSCPRRARPR